MDENTQAKFDAKLKELLAVAKKKKKCAGISGNQRFFSKICRLRRSSLSAFSSFLNRTM